MNARKTGGRTGDRWGTGGTSAGTEGASTKASAQKIPLLKRSQRRRLLVAAVKINGASCERTDLQGSERGRLGSLRGRGRGIPDAVLS